MEITQIQLSYLEIEDRMILRINMQEDKHVSFLLTRRICRFVLENLNAFLGVDVPSEPLVSPASAPQSQAAPEENQSPRPLDNMDMKTPFQERAAQGNILNTGNNAALIINAACNRNDESVTFTLFIQDAEPLNLNLPKNLAMGIHQLMSGLTSQAQWFAGLTTIAGAGSTQAEENKVESGKVIYH